jgi:hypothetical protein
MCTEVGMYKRDRRAQKKTLDEFNLKISIRKEEPTPKIEESAQFPSFFCLVLENSKYWKSNKKKIQSVSEFNI